MPVQAQQDVIDKMKNGWKLKRDFYGDDSKVWMIRSVRLSTLYVLINKGLIDSDDQYPLETYHLTAKAEGKDG